MTVTLKFLAVSLLLVIFTGCSSPRIFVQTDPDGADVHEQSLGYLGVTPLTREFKSKDLKRLSQPMTLNLSITKRGFVEEKMSNISLSKKEQVNLKRNLTERLKYIDITSDPDGVAVFHCFIDSPAYERLDANARLAMLSTNPNDEVKRFLGNTPIRYQDNTADPMKNGDILRFKKALYKDGMEIFRDKEKRIHSVMQKK